MDYVKVQNEILKLTEKMKDNRYAARCLIEEQEDCIWYMIDYYCIRVPKDKWYLDTDRLCKSNGFKEGKVMDSYLQRLKNTMLRMDKTDKLVSLNKKRYVEFKGNDVVAYYDEKIIKLFDKDEPVYKIGYPVSKNPMLYILDKDGANVMGLILPVKYPKNDKN